MYTSSMTKAALAVLLAGLTILGVPLSGQCASYYWGKHPDHERLVLQFDNQVPDYTLKRSGRKSLSVSLAPGEWTEEKVVAPPNGFSGSELIESVSFQGREVIVQTRTPSFGYLHFIYGQNKLVMDFFFDPIGAKWQQQEKKEDKTAPSPETIPSIAEQPDPADESVQDQQALQETEEQIFVEEQKNLQTSDRSEDSGPDEKNVKLQKRETGKPSLRLPETETGSSQVRGRALRVGPDNPNVIDGEPADIQEGKTPDAGQSMEGRDDAGTIPKEKDISPEEPERKDSTPETSDRKDPVNLKIKQAQKDLIRGNYQDAINSLEYLNQNGTLNSSQRELVLYNLAEALYQSNIHDPEPEFDEIITAYQRAMNANPDSVYLPHALLNIGHLHLLVGNEPEARAYFNILRNKFPEDSAVPVSYFFEGEYYSAKKDFNQAADHYQVVVEEHPESSIVLQASMGLIQALKELEFNEQASEVIAYVDKRWPTYYLEDPDFLRLAGIVAMQGKDLDEARDKLWAYYNLVPDSENVDLVLARLGDIYLLQDDGETARQVYEIAATRYPEKEGGVIATMRLAEEGIYDEPSLVDMFSVFEQPDHVRPVEVYSKISQDHADLPLGSVAQVKLAMYHLWNDQPEQSLEKIKTFEPKLKEHGLWSQALEVSAKAFDAITARMVSQERFIEVLDLMDRFPFLQEALPNTELEGRMALALSLWKTGESDRAIEVSYPVVRDPLASPVERTMAFDLLLGIYVEQKKWDRIVELREMMKEHEFTPDQDAQLRYGLALAYENKGQLEKSQPLWRELSVNPRLKVAQRGYAFYFLARHAFAENDYRETYLYAEQAVSNLIQDRQDISKIRDSLDLLLEVSKKTGRTVDALKWAVEYQKWLDEDDEGWPSFQYHTAGLFKTAGDVERWRIMLEEIIEKKPNSLYARLAASDIKDFELSKQAKSYR